MNIIKPDEVYTAVRVSKGTSWKGPWRMIVVNDDAGNNQLPIFAFNSDVHIGDGDRFRIVEIKEVRFGFKKDENGLWKPNCSVGAIVEKLVSFQEYNGGVLPWKENEDE